MNSVSSERIPSAAEANACIAEKTHHLLRCDPAFAYHIRRFKAATAQAVRRAAGLSQGVDEKAKCDPHAPLTPFAYALLCVELEDGEKALQAGLAYEHSKFVSVQ